jgi:hypothetical protein
MSAALAGGSAGSAIVGRDRVGIGLRATAEGSAGCSTGSGKIGSARPAGATGAAGGVRRGALDDSVGTVATAAISTGGGRNRFQRRGMVALAAVAPHKTSATTTGPLTRPLDRFAADPSSAIHTRRFRVADGSSGSACFKSAAA